MIIVSLFDGLGNQMFQYAVARHLAEKHSTALKLDVSLYESEYKRTRKYGLHCFNIQENLATQDEIRDILRLPRNKIESLRRKAIKYFGVSNGENIFFLQEDSFHFNPNILESPNNCYLFGYWQSEKYFADIRDILRCEFSIKYPQDPQSEALSEKIKSCESIALHVRRGDYIQNQETYQHHGICSKDYYERSMAYIVERTVNPYFFIFSDDPLWAKENLTNKFPSIVVEHNTGFRSYEDLRLMSQCKHNIIANSSFSWWGAWLNSNPDKIVCGPKHWFKNNISDTKYAFMEEAVPWYKDRFLDTKDLIPDGWIRF